MYSLSIRLVTIEKLGQPNNKLHSEPMAYGYDYGSGQRLILDNPGEQTVITLASSAAGIS